jgi:aspartate aminotransferase
MSPDPSTTQTPLPLSGSVLSVPRSATLAINELAKRMASEGEDIVHLGLGQSPFPVPGGMVSALQDTAGAKEYLQVQGHLPLREAIARYLERTEGVSRDAEQVIVGPGSKELIFGLQLALDGDLILPAPSWVSYAPQARMLGRRVQWLECRAEDGWKLTAETLERHCQRSDQRHQLLILNSPCNPTGACFRSDELEALAQVARKYQVIVLSDEIYSELHYEGRHQSIARHYPEGTIISNGISKWAGAGGWRLGAFSFPDALEPVLAAMIDIASETFTSVSAPVQLAAIKAFEGSDEMTSYIDATRRIMASIGTLFSAQLQELGADVVTPDGGFYNLPDFSAFGEPLARSGITTASDFCQELLNHTGIAGLPGSAFGLEEGLLVRFAFVDFDGGGLLERVLADPTLSIDQDTEELGHMLSAVPRMADWLTSL